MKLHLEAFVPKYSSIEQMVGRFPIDMEKVIWEEFEGGINGKSDLT
jgi:hypothetical protein